MIDIRPATNRMSHLLEQVSDDQFDRPTPCPDLSLGDVIDHVGTFARAFGAVARKDTAGLGAPPPAKAANLEDGWRGRIARDLDALADAWGAPEAWTGMTAAGGIDLPGEVAGLVALDELVIHGWDIARTTGQAYDCDTPSLEAVHAFVSQFSEPGQEEARAGLFGPVVEVPDDAPLLDRVIGLTGRDPRWSSG